MGIKPQKLTPGTSVIKQTAQTGCEVMHLIADSNRFPCADFQNMGKGSRDRTVQHAVIASARFCRHGRQITTRFPRQYIRILEHSGRYAPSPPRSSFTGTAPFPHRKFFYPNTKISDVLTFTMSHLPNHYFGHTVFSY